MKLLNFRNTKDEFGEKVSSKWCHKQVSWTTSYEDRLVQQVMPVCCDGDGDVVGDGGKLYQGKDRQGKF